MLMWGQPPSAGRSGEGGWPLDQVRQPDTPAIAYRRITDSPQKNKSPKTRFPSVSQCLRGELALSLVRNRREQLRVHQRLKLLVARFEMELHIRTIRLHAGIIHRHFFRSAGAHLLIEQPSLHQ